MTCCGKGLNSGSVEFVASPATGMLSRTLWGPDIDPGEGFGNAIALSSTGVAIVGSVNHRHCEQGDAPQSLDCKQTGAVYIFFPETEVPPPLPPQTPPQSPALPPAPTSPPNFPYIGPDFPGGWAGLLLTVFVVVVPIAVLAKFVAIPRYRRYKAMVQKQAERRARVMEQRAAAHVEAEKRSHDKGLADARAAIAREVLKNANILFTKHDVDKSNTIDRSELVEALRELGIDPSTHDVSEILKDYDADNNATLDRAEFMKLVRVILAKQRVDAKAAKAETVASRCRLEAPKVTATQESKKGVLVMFDLEAGGAAGEKERSSVSTQCDPPFFPPGAVRPAWAIPLAARPETPQFAKKLKEQANASWEDFQKKRTAAPARVTLKVAQFAVRARQLQAATAASSFAPVMPNPRTTGSDLGDEGGSRPESQGLSDRIPRSALRPSHDRVADISPGASGGPYTRQKQHEPPDPRLGNPGL